MSRVPVARSHPDCLLHVPPLGHPDPPARLRLVLEAAAAAGWEVEEEAELPPPDDVQGALRWIHDEEHLERIRRTAAGGGDLGAEVPVSEGSWRAVVAAAGVVLSSGLDLVNERVQRVFAVVRPGGHHAGRARSRGFDLVNTAALAATTIERAWNRPVLIVDLDAHHGDGTQELVLEERGVSYLSVHRHPAFPGTGGGDELGDVARRRVFLVPLAGGSGDDVVVPAVRDALERAVEAVRPAALVVSAGFDLHHDDPLGEMALGDDGFAALGRALDDASRAHGAGRVLLVLEGGTGRGPLVGGAAALLRGMLGPSR